MQTFPLSYENVLWAFEMPSLYRLFPTAHKPLLATKYGKRLQFIVFIQKRPWECYGRNVGEFYFHFSAMVFVRKVIYLHFTPHHSILIYEIHFNFVVHSLTHTRSHAINTFSESKGKNVCCSFKRKAKASRICKHSQFFSKILKILSRGVYMSTKIWILRQK